ncbi:fungal-specific transcription factor domain-containing protein [Aspergillus tamarii]|uniref:Fungal-specific transcription factor domain-containing protein n=1 Tax=Aspergillus tamarii TaxID=41984 RepID=A0A5N6UX73_ASPTM|nr:fungal-specific transcription factor domain-containing protein [Aspergillus tamarii]
MTDTRSSNKQRARTRVRAGKACTRCHEKRIKCDAMNQMPCTHCLRDRHAECVLRETKRGTYTRSGLRQKIGSDRPRPRSAAGVAGDSTSGSLNRVKDNGALPPHESDIAAAVQISASPPNSATRSSASAGHVQPRNGAEPSTLPAQQLAPVSESPRTQLSSGAPGDGSSYQAISWSAMFDHLLKNREMGRDWIDKCSITYLGESFPLAIVLGGLKDGSRPKLHHPGPPFPGTQANVPFQSQPTHMLPEDLEYLRAKGVFTLPEKAHLDVLIAVFLDRVYPLYPIVHRQEFIQQYKEDELSLILIYAVSFIAVTFASQSVLSLVGFESCQEARSFFYKKAKALFDMGYETNKITVLQSTFFLSFYGGGPNTYWNFYSWISTAVTIAEAIGIHRSTSAIANMQLQDKSLMRRLWWALVVRDSICGTLVGRPFRIDLDQADTDMLTIEDFAHDTMAPDFLDNPSAQKYAQYQIETAKLSLIMRDIIISRFYPGREPVRSEDLHARLTHWKAELVPTLTWDAEVLDYSNPFSMSLSVQYNHHLILIYLGHMRGENTCQLEEQEIEEIVDCAAHHIPTVVCALATKSALLTVPHELYHGIFLAQAAFYERMRSPNKLVARLGRSALNSCQVVLQAISQFWDCGTFIMQLFENLSSRALEQPSWTTDNRQESCGSGIAEASGVSGTMNSANEAGVFNALLGEDRWQGNPMLESLFDLPPELFLPE